MSQTLGQAGLRPALLALVEPDVRGESTSPLRWTTKSTRTLAAELTRAGHKVSADTVGDLLREEGFSLQGNAKTKEGKQHPDRDAQFRFLNEQAQAYLSRGLARHLSRHQEEGIGRKLREFRAGMAARGEAGQVDGHDFPDRDVPKAVPRGVYD